MPQEQDSLHLMRHSAAHVLAAALTELYPEVKLGVGPVIEDGFYYDVQLSQTVSEADLAPIEAKMKEIIARDEEFRRQEKPLAPAL